MFFFLKVAFLIGGDFLTRADDIPNCVDTYSFPTVRTALGAIYAKRSQLQPPVYNINEQFSPNVHRRQSDASTLGKCLSTHLLLCCLTITFIL
jgi:hypothetical protein